jgi:hypothetical protein
MTVAKRHHYIPRFYLEPFCTEGLLWLYDRESREYRRQTAENTAVQTHYYSYEEESGAKNTAVEELLSKIEGHAKLAISSIEEGHQLSTEQRKDLAMFLAFLRTRIPDFEEEVNDVFSVLVKKDARLRFGSSQEDTQAVIERVEAWKGEKFNVSAKELLEFVERENYDVETNRNVSLSLMLDVGLHFAEYFLQMDWLFFRAHKESSFVTSDSPFVVVPPAGWNSPRIGNFGVLTHGSGKLIPLSPTLTIVMLDKGNRDVLMNASKDTVRLINITITAKSRRFVISRDELLLKSLVRKTRIYELERGKRIRIP